VIACLHLDLSPALDALIRADVARLERLFPRMTGCHVSVARVDHRHHRGSRYEVCIEVRVPDRPLVVRHRSLPGVDAYVAIREGFRAATRRLENYIQRRRDRAKRPGRAKSL
jgi:ribosome-associated translation inhibitor RaiA